MTTVNIERNILYWNIGKMIEEYSQWGSKFVENLSKDLRKEYPNSTGYTVNNLNYMSQFLDVFGMRKFCTNRGKN